MKQEIEKIVEALKAAEMRQGCTDYHVYAEKLYEDLFPKPSANREAAAEEIENILAEAWRNGKKRKGIDVTEKAHEILALWPKVLSDEEIEHILTTQDAICELGASGKDDGSCSLCQSIKAKLGG